VERGRRKWVRHNLSNAIVYGGLFHGAARLPMPVLLAINAVGNSIAVATLRSTMADLADNFGKALGVPPGEARRLARAQFFSYGRATIDVWRCRSGRSELFPPIASREEDRARLFSARGHSGRGFLLVSAHIGNWEMGAVALRSHGLVPAVLGQQELDPDVQRMRRSIREQLGVESIDVGTSMTTALRVRAAVERGSVVALVADRAYDDDQVTVPLFGRPTRFLRSPALLARFCDCPILPGVYVRNEDGSYRSIWGDLLRADPDADPDADARRLMGEVARFVERSVRETPTQWFNFYRYWGDRGGSIQLS
jgi:KDO2-lipid IV(A) lauroyltransferase